MIEQIMLDHLKAVELKFGKPARESTVIRHQGGRSFVLKMHNTEKPIIVNIGRLKTMTKHISA